MKDFGGGIWCRTFFGDFRVKFGVLFLGGLRWRVFVVDFWSGKLALGLVVDFEVLIVGGACC